MAATLTYGGISVSVGDDEIAHGLRLLIGRIVRAGATEWLPLTGTGSDGKQVTYGLLVTPGVPIHITTDGDPGDALEELIGNYPPPVADA